MFKITGVDSAFNPSEANQMSTSNFWKRNGRSKLPPLSGSVALRQLNPIHKKGEEAIKFFKMLKGRKMLRHKWTTKIEI